MVDRISPLLGLTGKPINVTATEAVLGVRRREFYAWARLFDGLREWVQVRGLDPETDDALKAIADRLRLEWVTGLQGEGPEKLILETFRENADLWLQAAPADDVVVLPRKVFEVMIGVLHAGAPLAFPLQASDYEALGRHHVAMAADERRARREEDERMRDRR